MTTSRWRARELGEHSGTQATYQFDRREISASQLISRLSARFNLRDLAVREPDLESTIRRIYEEKLLED